MEGSYALTDLQNAMNMKHSDFHTRVILENLREGDYVPGCFLLLEKGNEEARSYALKAITNLSEEGSHHNFFVLLEAIGFGSEIVREAAKGRLSRFSGHALADNLHKLIKGLCSEYFLTRFYSEHFLSQMSVEDLMSRKDLVISTYKDGPKGEGCHPDWERAVKTLLVKILSGFDLLDVYQNREFLEKIIKASATDALNVAARLCLLRLVEDKVNNNEPIKELLSHWDLLTACEKINSQEIGERATLTKISIIERFSIWRKEDNIDYLSDFQKSPHKTIRYKSRQIVLSILEDWPREMLFKYRNFLIRCQESKHFFVRFRSLQLLRKIKKHYWAQDIEGLLSWHTSGYKYVRRTVRKILAELPGAFIPGQAVGALLKAQRYTDPTHQKLALILAHKIDARELKKAKELLKAEAQAVQKNVSSLANNLLQKVS